MAFPERGTPRIYDLSTDGKSVTITTPAEVENTLNESVSFADWFIEDSLKVSGAKTFTHFARPRWGFDEGVHSSHKENDEGAHQVFLPAPADLNPNTYIPSKNLECITRSLHYIQRRWEKRELQLQGNDLHLISVEIFLTGELQCGANISATLFPRFCEWLQTINKKTKPLSDACTVMLAAYSQIHGGVYPYNGFAFRIHLDPPDMLHMDVPGNATGLDTDRYRGAGEGYRLVPHNVDIPIQQLTLLVGLASLCQSARAAGF